MVVLYLRETNMKSLEEIRNKKVLQMAEDFQEKIANVKALFDEAIIICEKVDEISDYQFSEELMKCDFDFSSWGKYLTISNIKDSKLYQQMLIALVELYSEGEKSAFDDGIKYEFKKTGKFYSDIIYIALTVNIKVTGCKLIKEIVQVEEKIIPAHEEEKITVKCD